MIVKTKEGGAVERWLFEAQMALLLFGRSEISDAELERKAREELIPVFLKQLVEHERIKNRVFGASK
jgi:hypothetical protein